LVREAVKPKAAVEGRIRHHPVRFQVRVAVKMEMSPSLPLCASMTFSLLTNIPPEPQPEQLQ